LWTLRDSTPRPPPCKHSSPQRCAHSPRCATGKGSARANERELSGLAP
jgi:hypothetical protein